MISAAAPPTPTVLPTPSAPTAPSASTALPTPYTSTVPSKPSEHVIPEAIMPIEKPITYPIDTLYQTQAIPVDTNTDAIIAEATIVNTDEHHRIAMQYVSNQNDHEKEERLAIEQEEIRAKEEEKQEEIRAKEEKQEEMRKKEIEQQKQKHVARVRARMINAVFDFVNIYFDSYTGVPLKRFMTIPYGGGRKSTCVYFKQGMFPKLNELIHSELKSLVKQRNPLSDTFLYYQILHAIKRNNNILDDINKWIYSGYTGDKYKIARTNGFAYHNGYHYAYSCTEDYQNPGHTNNDIKRWFKLSVKSINDIIFNL
jgi:hypothetical protein